MTQAKTYSAHWGDGYAPTNDRTVDETFFSDDLGYDGNHRDAIEALDVGQTADLSDPGGDHMVTRLS